MLTAYESMPGLITALDPACMSSLLHTTVTDARLIRHKPERRALVRYATTSGPMIGKMRANHRSTTPFRLLQSLRAVGFDDNALDYIRVPEPVAVFSHLGLWVQRLVPGTSLVELLEAPEAVSDTYAPKLRDVGARAAYAAHKLHHSGLATRRTHTINDELRILTDRLNVVAEHHQQWSVRLHRLLLDFHTYADVLSNRPIEPIHRDFYPDQLIVDDRWLTVVDFDLFCSGDPAVDIGNFVGHVIELALRVHGDPHALQPMADTIIATYLDQAGELHRAAIDIYTRLTLARHISLSTQLPGRASTTEALIDLTEAWPASQATQI
jgi:hypothetical protein